MASQHIRKQVYTRNTGNTGWNASPLRDERFVYDGWNVVEVLNGLASNAVKTKYTWGLDLSGLSGNATAAGIHGAGGIGGLLACEEAGETSSTSYWYLYDGNGNVGQVITGANQELAARYEYDPYGNAIAAVNVNSSGFADRNPFRFSTKWFDGELGTYYYGYRYYLPRIGRWGSEDPIEEDGGLNLYGFVGNEPAAKTDALGLCVVGTVKSGAAALPDSLTPNCLCETTKLTRSYTFTSALKVAVAPGVDVSFSIGITVGIQVEPGYEAWLILPWTCVCREYVETRCYQIPPSQACMYITVRTTGWDCRHSAITAMDRKCAKTK